MHKLKIGLCMLAVWAFVRADAAWCAVAGQDASVGTVRPGLAAEADSRLGAEEVEGAAADPWPGRPAEASGASALRSVPAGGYTMPDPDRQGCQGGSGAAQAASPMDRAAELVSALGGHMRALGNYEVRFAVQTGDGAAEGSYVVSGDRYHMRMGTAEIYSDGMVRYEVNNRMREVTVDAVDTASRNILNNPTRAFDLAGDAFEPELQWEHDGRAAVRLVPRPGQPALSAAVTVTIDTRRMRPLSLEYDFDGDRIRIDVLGMEGGTPPPAAFDRAAYAGYELIDFR